MVLFHNKSLPVSDQVNPESVSVTVNVSNKFCEPAPPVAVIVNVSVVSSVVKLIPLPAANVNVSVELSAIIVFCPETATFKNHKNKLSFCTYTSIL